METGSVSKLVTSACNDLNWLAALRLGLGVKEDISTAAKTPHIVHCKEHKQPET